MSIKSCIYDKTEICDNRCQFHLYVEDILICTLNNFAHSLKRMASQLRGLQNVVGNTYWKEITKGDEK